MSEVWAALLMIATVVCVVWTPIQARRVRDGWVRPNFTGTREEFVAKHRHYLWRTGWLFVAAGALRSSWVAGASGAVATRSVGNPACRHASATRSAESAANSPKVYSSWGISTAQSNSGRLGPPGMVASGDRTSREHQRDRCERSATLTSTFGTSGARPVATPAWPQPGRDTNVVLDPRCADHACHRTAHTIVCDAFMQVMAVTNG
jgi:hypothetical protein